MIPLSNLDKHWEELSPYIMTGSNDRARFDSLHMMMKTIDEQDIEGDIAECGVYAGGNSIWLARLFPDRTIWVMDSFKGCQNENDGHHVSKSEPHHEGLYAYPLESVKKNFIECGVNLDDRIRFVEGYFRDTLYDHQQDLPEKLALLRIDCDAHSAYLEVLHALFDRVSPGGFIVFDDYSLPEIYRRALPNFFSERRLHPKILTPEGTAAVPVGSKLPSVHQYGSYMRK